MEFKLHGVRGSIPVPSKEALKYGGNTTCIEISNASFQLIIDLGSGFQNVKIRKKDPGHSCQHRPARIFGNTCVLEP